MRLDITGRHVTITPALRQLINQRLKKLERLLNDAAISATIILTKEKYRHLAEIVIHARGDHMMRGTGEGNAWPASLRDAASRIEQQAQKLKSRWTESKRQRSSPRLAAAATAAVREPAPPPAPRILRNARYPVKPMSVEDAALRVESGPDTFVVFRNAETDAVSILYRRKDGHFGLIEPE
jgi:putative sigma-54 modulation protein